MLPYHLQLVATNSTDDFLQAVNQRPAHSALLSVTAKVCSIPTHMQGCQSRGSVCKAGRTGSIIELQRIEGAIFKTSKEAESHGLELARARVDRKSAWRVAVS
jgi:hypothetical protein